MAAEVAEKLDREPGTPAIQVVLGEYHSLRAEIGRFQDHQQQILGFGFLVFGAVAAGIGSAISGAGKPSLEEALRSFHILLLVTPFVYLFLAMLFAERTIRILRVGDYIDSSLRPLVETIVGPGVLGWEEYRRNPQLFSRFTARLLDLGRWAEFAAPILLCIALIWWVHPGLQPTEKVAVGLDVLALIVCIVLGWRIDESAGVRPPKRGWSGFFIRPRRTTTA